MGQYAVGIVDKRPVSSKHPTQVCLVDICGLNTARTGSSTSLTLDSAEDVLSQRLGYHRTQCWGRR